MSQQRQPAMIRWVARASAALCIVGLSAGALFAEETRDTKDCAQLSRLQKVPADCGTGDVKGSSRDLALEQSMHAIEEKVSTASGKTAELDRARKDAQEKFTTDLVVGAHQAGLQRNPAGISALERTLNGRLDPSARGAIERVSSKLLLDFDNPEFSVDEALRQVHVTLLQALPGADPWTLMDAESLLLLRALSAYAGDAGSSEYVLRRKSAKSEIRQALSEAKAESAEAAAREKGDDARRIRLVVLRILGIASQARNQALRPTGP